MDTLLWFAVSGMGMVAVRHEEGVPRRGQKSREKKCQYPRSLLPGFPRDSMSWEACPQRLDQTPFLMAAWKHQGTGK